LCLSADPAIVVRNDRAAAPCRGTVSEEMNAREQPAVSDLKMRDAGTGTSGDGTPATEGRLPGLIRSGQAQAGC
jgi:hypothetical protein